MLENNDGRAFGGSSWARPCLTNRCQAARATLRISNVRPCANDGGGPNGICHRVLVPAVLLGGHCPVALAWRLAALRRLLEPVFTVRHAPAVRNHPNQRALLGRLPDKQSVGRTAPRAVLRDPGAERALLRPR